MPNGTGLVSPDSGRIIKERRPSLADALGELRFPFEATMLWMQALTYPWPHAEEGKGKVVMLIPGFMAGDMTLLPLANFIRWLGHHPYFAGIWSNSECPRALLQRLSQKLAGLHRPSGRQIVLLGQSLGGLYARELAHRYPEFVEQVMTLGSPIYAPLGYSNLAVLAVAHTVAMVRGRARGCLSESCTCGLALPEEVAERVPTTVIYSRSDGVVHFDSCIDKSGSPLVENVEVMGSHVGMGLNAEVYRIVADRLVRSYEKGLRRVTPIHPAAQNPSPI